MNRREFLTVLPAVGAVPFASQLSDLPTASVRRPNKDDPGVSVEFWYASKEQVGRIWIPVSREFKSGTPELFADEIGRLVTFGILTLIEGT